MLDLLKDRVSIKSAISFTVDDCSCQDGCDDLKKILPLQTFYLAFLSGRHPLRTGANINSPRDYVNTNPISRGCFYPRKQRF